MTSGMHKGTFIVKEANQSVPADFMKLVNERNPGGCGITAYNAQTKQLELISSKNHMDDPNWANAQEQFKGEKAIFSFSNLPDNTPDNNIQPLLLITSSAGDPLITGVLDGDFGQFSSNDVNSEEYHAANKFLIPTLQEYLELFNNDLDKVWEHLKKPKTHEKMLNSMIGHRGAIALFLANGHAISFHKENTLGDDFPWGYASNTFSYGQPPVTATPPSTNRMAALMGSAAPVSPPAAEPTEIVSEDEFEMLEPPVNIQGKNSLRNWYEKLVRQGRLAAVPANFKDRPKIKVKKESDPKATAKTFEDAARLIRSKDSAGPSSNIKDKPKEEIIQTGNLPATAAITPIIDQEQKQHFLDNFMKTIDVNNLEIMDPQQIADFEKEYLNLSDQFGIPAELANGLRMSFGKKCNLADEYPKIAAVGWHNLVCAHIKLLAAHTNLAKDLKAANELLDEKTKTPPVTATSVPSTRKFGIR